MTFAKQSGPPASARQLQQLLTLLQQAGHTSFKDARGALGLTQRQALGKFSVGEAAELIELLEQAENGEAPTADHSPVAAPARPLAEVKQARDRSAGEARLQREREAAIRGVPAELLATELESRGWIVIPPV